MKGSDLRGLLGTVSFSAFAVIAVFFLFGSIGQGRHRNIGDQYAKIHINFGWIKEYGATLLVTFGLMIFIMDKRQVWPLVIGLVLGSILIEQYRMPGVAQVMNVFGQSATNNIQTYIPHLTVLLGALLVLALLKVTNRIFK